MRTFRETPPASASTEGIYRLKIRANRPKRRRVRGAALAPGETLDFPIPGFGEFRVRVTIKDREGGGCGVISVLDPEGVEVAGAAGLFARKRSTTKATLDLVGPAGDYTVRIGGAAARTTLDVAYAAKFAKVRRRKLDRSPVQPTGTGHHPHAGRPGTSVTIEGESFPDGAIQVWFGDLPSPTVTRVSGTKLLAEAPAGSGEVPVAVHDADGQSGTSPVTFGYMADPPMILSVSPWNGPETGGTVIDVLGRNLTHIVMVQLDGSVMSTGFELIDDGHVRFVTDSHQPGHAALVLIDEWGQTATRLYGFQFLGVSPLIKNPDLEDGTGETVTSWYAIPHDSGSAWEPVGAGYDGGRCVSMETATPRNDLYWLHYITGLVPGRWYNVSANIRGENIEVFDKTAAGAWGGNIALLGKGRWRSVRGTAYQGTFDWKQVSFTFLAETYTAQLVCRLGTEGNRATGRVMFDNLSITEDDFAGSPHEGDRVALVLEAEDIADSGMTEETLETWIENLAEACETYADLVGGHPYGGEKITIASVRQYPGGWAVAGNPILWEKRYVERTLRSVHEDGNWSFGILHEIGHDYDLDYSWVYNAEISANFKMVYVLEKLGGTVGQRGVLYPGAAIKHIYEMAYDEAKAAGEATSWGGWVYRLLCIKDEIGWEPFRQTYRAFTEKPETKVDRLNRLLDDLSGFSGLDVREELIPTDELDWVVDRLD